MSLSCYGMPSIWNWLENENISFQEDVILCLYIVIYIVFHLSSEKTLYSNLVRANQNGGGGINKHDLTDLENRMNTL